METLDSWSSYTKIYQLGHAEVRNLFSVPVIVEEKIDGSQFSFGKFGSVIRCRSRNQILIPEEVPESHLFYLAVQSVLERADLLRDGWTYRGEYLRKRRHNALTYDRIPEGHIIVYDINDGHESYVGPGEKAREAERIGLEVVPFHGTKTVTAPSELLAFLEEPSCLGGMREGVVCKQYELFGRNGKALMGKYVSEKFKEVHDKTWKKTNPNAGDIFTELRMRYATEARWHKALQHLRDSGQLQGAPQDIPALIKEVGQDTKAECEEEIKEFLFKWAWKKLNREIIRGLPEWYKQQLLEEQFAACCVNEQRNMNGGCDNCGDPSF